MNDNKIALILLTFFLPTFTCRAMALQPVSLDQCDFWIGRTVGFANAVEPICSCYKTDWSSPEIVHVDAAPEDGKPATPAIPANWSKGENPPPLSWTIACPGKTALQATISNIQIYSDTSLIRLGAKGNLPDDCVALSGNLSVQFPTSVPDSSSEVASLLPMLRSDFQNARQKEFERLQQGFKKNGLVFSHQGSQNTVEWNIVKFVSPKSGQPMYDIRAKPTIGTVSNPYNNSNFTFYLQLHLGYQKSDADFQKIFDASKAGWGDDVLTPKDPMCLLNVKGHQIFLVREQYYDGYKTNLEELDDQGQWKTIFEGQYLGG